MFALALSAAHAASPVERAHRLRFPPGAAHAAHATPPPAAHAFHFGNDDVTYVTTKTVEDFTGRLTTLNGGEELGCRLMAFTRIFLFAPFAAPLRAYPWCVHTHLHARATRSGDTDWAGAPPRHTCVSWGALAVLATLIGPDPRMARSRVD